MKSTDIRQLITKLEQINESGLEDQDPFAKSTQGNYQDEVEADHDDSVNSSDDGGTGGNDGGFKKIGAKFGPDLYSFSSLAYLDDWNAPNDDTVRDALYDVDLPDINFAVRSMKRADGDDGLMTFIVLNARTGDLFTIGFGEGAEGEGVNIENVDPDQQRVVAHLEQLYSEYNDALNSYGESEEANSVREDILGALNYFGQKNKGGKAEKYKNMFYANDEERQKDADSVAANIDKLRAKTAAYQKSREQEKTRAKR